MLTPGETLRLKAVLDDTVKALEVVEQVHTLQNNEENDENVNPAMGNHISQLEDKYSTTLRNARSLRSPLHDQTIKSLNLLKEMNQQFLASQSVKTVTDKKVFLRDSKKLQQDCKSMISILKSTTRELSDKHDWAYMRDYVQNQLNKQRNIKDLLITCNEIINRKRDLQQQMIVEKRDFETESVKMKQQVSVLEKELASLVNSVQSNTAVEEHTVNAQEKSLCFLYQTRIDKLQLTKAKIESQFDIESKAHQTQMQFYETYYKNATNSFEEEKKQQNDDSIKLDQMIDEMNTCLKDISIEIDNSKKIVQSFDQEIDNQKKMQTFKEKEQQDVAMERDRKMAIQILGKLVAKFEKNKEDKAKKGKGKKGKGKKGKSKKKKK